MWVSCRVWKLVIDNRVHLSSSWLCARTGVLGSMGQVIRLEICELLFDSIMAFRPLQIYTLMAACADSPDGQ